MEQIFPLSKQLDLQSETTNLSHNQSHNLSTHTKNPRIKYTVTIMREKKINLPLECYSQILFCSNNHKYESRSNSIQKNNFRHNVSSFKICFPWYMTTKEIFKFIYQTKNWYLGDERETSMQ